MKGFARRAAAKSGMALVAAALPGLLQAAEIYKSIDANGHVVYSDHPDPALSQTTAVQLGEDGQISTYSAPPPLADGFVSTEAPPPLADDPQPEISQEGYLWTPGYWVWNGRSYVWIRGAWLAPPQAGLLWTPAYWQFVNSTYVFHQGYWGPHVGFYGGINYGFGYFGTGYVGGRWVGNSFAYNSSVSHVNPNIVHSTYAAPVAAPPRGRGASFNGGPGGTTVVPSTQELAAGKETHVPAVAMLHQNGVRVAVASSAPGVAGSGSGPNSVSSRHAAVNHPLAVGDPSRAVVRGAAEQKVGSAPPPRVTPPPSTPSPPKPQRAVHKSAPIK